MAQTRHQKAQNFGANAAKAWLWVKVKESALVHFLSSKGIPAVLSKLLVFIFNVAVAAALLYAAFWLVVFAVVAFFFFAVLNQPESDLFTTETDPEIDGHGGKWVHGSQGFGYYIDGCRADGGESED